MFDLLGLLVSVAALVVGIATAFFPPKDHNRKWVHSIYIVGFLVTSTVFSYVLWNNDRQIAQMKEAAVEKERLSSQAKAMFGSLGESTEYTCRGIVLTAFTFVEKWRNEIPSTFAIANDLVKRSLQVVSDEDRYSVLQARVRQCGLDADAMKQLLRGLATQ